MIPPCRGDLASVPRDRTSAGRGGTTQGHIWATYRSWQKFGSLIRGLLDDLALAVTIQRERLSQGVGDRGRAQLAAERVVVHAVGQEPARLSYCRPVEDAHVRVPVTGDQQRLVPGLFVGT